MKLTDKCKEDFEKWFLTDDNNGTSYVFGEAVLKFTESITKKFYSLPESMQYSVYVDFFDEHGIYIDIRTEIQSSRSVSSNFETAYHYKPDSWYGIINGNNKELGYTNGYKTRQEARKQAINKANELYNK